MRFVRWTWLALALFAAAGCDDERLVGTSGEVRVSAETVEFPRAYVGYPVSATVAVENTGRSPVELRARVDEPFRLEAPPARIPGVGTVTLTLSFTPASAGRAEGTLTVEAGGESFRVALAGTAVPVPDCTTAAACRIASFDPVAGTCIHQAAPDDTPCSDHCIADGVCLDGVCRGAGDGCDDGDPCTRDLIAGDCSCYHEPVEERPTNDPCRVETCEPGVGWKVTRAPDGTICGPVSECIGSFCDNGACVTVAEAPEGTICRQGNPCRKPSRCVRGSGGIMECEPARAETVLNPVWRVTPLGGKRLHFEAVTDERYVYWAECDDAGCGLRSISPMNDREETGGSAGTAIDPDPDPADYWSFDRYDGLAPMFSGPVARNGGLLLSRGLVYSTLREGFLEAYRSDTGEAAFRIDLRADGIPLGRGSTAVNAYGDVVLILGDTYGVGHTVIAVSPAGTVAWRARRAGTVFPGLVADEGGSVFFGEETADGFRLVSLGGAGIERFAVETMPAAPLGVFAGRLLHGTADGLRIAEPLPILVPDVVLPPILSPTVGWLAGYPVDERGPRWTDFSLFRFDPATGGDLDKQLLRNSVPWGRSEPLLLAADRSRPGDRLLYSHGTGACDAKPSLLEFTRDNAYVMSCELAPGSYGGPATVLSSLWLAYDSCRGSVAAFLLEVAGKGPRDLAPQGWIGGGGDPGRTGRPLP